MTCFWDSIISKINKNDFHTFNLLSKPKPLDFCNLLIQQNTNTNNISWKTSINNEILSLTEKQKKENYEHIQSFQSNSIQNGYYCSTFDPFLFLIAELFHISIINNFNQSIISYLHTNPKYSIHLHNNTTHMK